jgi:cytoskeletal protein CcmA (bactofilin family)
LEGHRLTIGQHGVIQADVQAENIVVHGRLEGNVVSNDKVEISASGSVLGDIRAPRVAIQDGATFGGSIDMEVGETTRADASRSDTEGAGSTPSGPSVSRTSDTD